MQVSGINYGSAGASLPVARPSAEAASATVPLASLAARYSDAVDSAQLVDNVFNLSRTPGETGALLDGAREVASKPGGGSAFLSMLATLIKQGVVGSESLEVRGEKYTSFVESRFAASNDVRDARPYRLDLAA
jgi:hypothetical protein